eukprot:scaffold18815_cov22-Tisochrysis_lutea.AAC.1
MLPLYRLQLSSRPSVFTVLYLNQAQTIVNAWLSLLTDTQANENIACSAQGEHSRSIWSPRAQETITVQCHSGQTSLVSTEWIYSLRWQTAQRLIPYKSISERVVQPHAHSISFNAQPPRLRALKAEQPNKCGSISLPTTHPGL